MTEAVVENLSEAPDEDTPVQESVPTSSRLRLRPGVNKRGQWSFFKNEGNGWRFVRECDEVEACALDAEDNLHPFSFVLASGHLIVDTSILDSG